MAALAALAPNFKTVLSLNNEPIVTAIKAIGVCAKNVF